MIRETKCRISNKFQSFYLKYLTFGHVLFSYAKR